MDDLHYLSAVEALARFRAKELSPVELMEAVIARAEAVEPTVNAFTHTRFEQALDEAATAADRYARTDVELRPLEGLPVGLKDEVPVEGWPWSNGSLIMRDEIADHTAPVAQRILDAGGIVHARTTTPEFSCAAFTHTRLWGVTRNPWSPEWGVGGSSGGSGAALAAGTVSLASASDIGGSIRLPASFCGVVGFKPPYGRVPVDPHSTSITIAMTVRWRAPLAIVPSCRTSSPVPTRGTWPRCDPRWRSRQNSRASRACASRSPCPSATTAWSRRWPRTQRPPPTSSVPPARWWNRSSFLGPASRSWTSPTRTSAPSSARRSVWEPPSTPI